MLKTTFSLHLIRNLRDIDWKSKKLNFKNLCTSEKLYHMQLKINLVVCQHLAKTKKKPIVSVIKSARVDTKMNKFVCSKSKYTINYKISNFSIFHAKDFQNIKIGICILCRRLYNHT